MPAVYERAFRIRHYECDAFGHLNNVSYLRYMQEAAYDASAAVGYGMVSYAQSGHRWFVRETNIEYLTPVYYGDSVTVRTWVMDFHRVRSKRAYEIYFSGTDRLAARGWSDWVYLETETNRPTSIPSEMIKAFIPEWSPEMVHPRQRYPTAPTRPKQVFSMRRQVEWRDLDPANHVNNATYLVYIQECGIQLGKAFGWPYERSDNAGILFVPRRHHIEYRISALLGEELEITTWLSNVRRSMLTRHFFIHRASDQELLAQDQTLYVAIDKKSLQPVRIPPALIADFAENISPERDHEAD
jgi:acyl-CoA thioester hydrolase